MWSQVWYFYWHYSGVRSFPVIILQKLMQVPWIPFKALISLQGGEDEPTQGQTIHNSNCNQEEMSNPPFLCKGRAAQGLQGVALFSSLWYSTCHSATQPPTTLSALHFVTWTVQCIQQTDQHFTLGGVRYVYGVGAVRLHSVFFCVHVCVCC